MKTSIFLLNYWNFNLTAVIFVILLILFHYISNGNRFSHKTPLFLLAVLLYVIATLSPIDYLGKHFLLSAHMIQHILLLLVIPPMILVSTSRNFFIRMSQNRIFLKSSNFLFYPLIAWLLGVGTMWILHIPTFLKAIGDSPFLMNMQLVVLPILGFIFIWPAFSLISWKKLDPLSASVYLFLGCIGCTVLGILITFSQPGLYMPTMLSNNLPVREMITKNWGFTMMNDQMAGGLIMWVPACVLYMSYIIVILLRWFRLKENEETEKTIQIEKTLKD